VSENVVADASNKQRARVGEIHTQSAHAFVPSKEADIAASKYSFVGPKLSSSATTASKIRAVLPVLSIANSDTLTSSIVEVICGTQSVVAGVLYRK
jgi:hypothetical protein